jgi:hypothetical protein
MEPVSEVSFRLPTALRYAIHVPCRTPVFHRESRTSHASPCTSLQISRKKLSRCRSHLSNFLVMICVTYAVLFSRHLVLSKHCSTRQRPSSTTVLRCSTLSESPITSNPGCFHPCVKTSLKPVASPATLKIGSLTTEAPPPTFVVNPTPLTPADSSHRRPCASVR